MCKEMYASMDISIPHTQGQGNNYWTIDNCNNKYLFLFIIGAFQIKENQKKKSLIFPEKIKKNSQEEFQKQKADQNNNLHKKKLFFGGKDQGEKKISSQTTDLFFPDYSKKITDLFEKQKKTDF